MLTDGVVLKFSIGESKGLWLDPMQTAIHMQFQAVNQDSEFLLLFFGAENQTKFF